MAPRSLAPARYRLVETRLGWIGLVFSDSGLRAATLPCPAHNEALRAAAALGAGGPATPDDLGALPQRLVAYAEGRNRDLSARIDWNGVNGFRRRVMEETLRIPYGETRTYGWLAAKVGRRRAARAVGRVNATNPLSIIVPCHRLVGSDGSLRGYGGGLAMKETLLRLEGARVQGSPGQSQGIEELEVRNGRAI